MANLEGAKVKVSVESVVHQALADLVQRIETEHGLRVHSLAVEWADVSGVNGHAALVHNVRVDATSFPVTTR